MDGNEIELSGSVGFDQTLAYAALIPVTEKLVRAETAIRAGASGQLVLATVHSTNTAEAVDMMLQYDSDHIFLSSALAGVINQRLVRRLCQACRKPAEATTSFEVHERIRGRMQGNDPALFEPCGCPQCHEVGYDTLIALPEIMQVDQAREHLDALRQLAVPAA